MESNATVRPSITGYLIVLVGVVGWVVGCFLPLYTIDHGGRANLFASFSYSSVWNYGAGVLYLFGGVITIGVISTLGVLRTVRTGTRFLLIGAVAAWSVAFVGFLISIVLTLDGFNTDVVLGLGYWCCWASVIAIVTGTVIVIISGRADARSARTAPEMIGYQIPPSAPGGGVAT